MEIDRKAIHGTGMQEIQMICHTFMKINGKLMFASTVDIIDISLGGIALQTNRALKIGRIEY